MKIQINITPTTKEVVVEESCNLKELAAFMQVSFPEHYPEFKLVPKVIINQGTPIIINPYVTPYWRQPWYGNVNYNSGTYTSNQSYVGDAGLAPAVNTLASGTYSVIVDMRNTASTPTTEI